jgi:hypothetical protein
MAKQRQNVIGHLVLLNALTGCVAQHLHVVIVMSDIYIYSITKTPLCHILRLIIDTVA